MREIGMRPKELDNSGSEWRWREKGEEKGSEKRRERVTRKRQLKKDGCGSKDEGKDIETRKVK